MISYNHEPFIKKAIDSILMQKTTFKFNLVIGDDCSTDKTLKVIKKYYNNSNDKIHLITSEKNVGMLMNFIRTLNACTGKYISICEGDDYWTDPYKLQKQVDFLEANPEYGLVSTDINLIDKDGNPLPDNNMVIRQRMKRKPFIDFFDLLETNSINTLTVCARADLLKELINRIIKKNLWFVYDYWFWLNIALVSKIKISYEKTAAYRIHDDGISRSKDFFEFRKALVKKDAIIQGFKKVKWYNLRKIYLLFWEACKLTMNLIITRRFKVIWSLVHTGNAQYQEYI